MWQIDSQLRLAIGDVHQQSRIAGSTTTSVPNSNPVTTAGGLLAQPTNIGTLTTDHLAILPEVNVNGKFYITNRHALNCGYTLLILSNALRASDQIDTTINPTQFAGGQLSGPARPQQTLTHTSFWVQGLNLGIEWFW
jgi:hypothetical protein